MSSPGTPPVDHELRRTRRAGSEARYVLREDLGGSVPPDVLERALVVASELVKAPAAVSVISLRRSSSARLSLN